MQLDSRQAVRLAVNDAPIEGCLAVPDGARGLVVVVNGGWGIRYASRESKLAVALQRRGFGTFTVGLLTPREDADRGSRFATDSQADRLGGVADWLDSRDRTATLPRGFLGVGPGAATALRAVDRYETGVRAVVGVDGRFGTGVEDVDVPTLLVLARRDDRLREATDRVRRQLGGEDHDVVVLHDREADRTRVTGGVDLLAGDWFERHLV